MNKKVRDIVLKLFLVIIAQILWVSFVFPQNVLATTVPINYQGRLSDSSSDLLTGTYRMLFCVYTASSSTACTDNGTSVTLNNATYGEAQATITVTNGVFNVTIGAGGSRSTGTFPNFQLNSTSYYIGVNVYNTGGSAYDGEMTPRQQIEASSFSIDTHLIDGFSASQTPGASNVPVLDASGYLNLSGTNPQLNASSTNTLTLQGSAGGTGNIQFFNSSSFITSGGNLTTNGNITVNGTGNSSIAGNVGIGNTSPGGLLDVSKSISGTPSLVGQYLSLSSSTLTDNTAVNTNPVNAVFNSLGQDTLAATNAQTTTNAIGTYLTGAPIKGTNETITNSIALDIGAGATGAATNSYGLYVNAQTGATNNYAAYFNGSVGIGTTSPGSSYKLTIAGPSVGTLASDIQLTTSGAVQGERSALTMYSTFWNTFDNIPRRTADIIAGFNGGAWGNEYLSFNVGNNGWANDSALTTSEKMRIQRGGNVGIGTTSPGYLLDVNGTGRFSSNLMVPAGTAGSPGIKIGTGTGGIMGSGTNDIALVSNGINVATFVASTATDVRFQINTTNYSTMFGQFEGTWFGVNNPMIMQPLYPATAHDIAITGTQNSPTNGIVIKAAGGVGMGYADPGTAKLAISGNVGIGTTGPNGLLDISKSISGTPSLVGQYLSLSSSTLTDNTSGGTNPTNAVFNSLGQDTLASTNAQTTTNAIGTYLTGAPIKGTNETITNSIALDIGAGATGAATNSYGLYVNAQTGATNNYAAYFNGSVVIGTATGTSGYLKLYGLNNGTSGGDTAYIYGPGTGNGQFIQFRGPGGAGAGIAIDTGYGNNGSIYLGYGGDAGNTWDGAGDNIAIETAGAGSDRLYLTNSGNAYFTGQSTGVGIGTSTPSALFSVGSSSSFQVDNSGNITTSGILTQNNSSATNIAHIINLTSTAPTSAGGISVVQSPTVTTTVADTGNDLNINRAFTTNTGGALTVTGALASFTSNCTVTAGTCTDSANVLALNQAYATASGDVLSISNSGTGKDISGANWNITHAGLGTFKGVSIALTSKLSIAEGSNASEGTGALVGNGAATTVTISTTSVTANSRIYISLDTTNGANVTCSNPPGSGNFYLSTKTAATSFVVTWNGTAPATNTNYCFDWFIIN